MKMELRYDSEKGYIIQGPKPGMSFISAVIKCEREDKKPNVQDCGLRQFENLMLPLDRKPEASEHIPSQIIKREAFSKSGKGGMAVRKFVLLKTNKEKTEHFSAYTLVYTDYSAGRKSPLDQDIYIFDNLKEAEEKFQLLKADNILFFAKALFKILLHRSPQKVLPLFCCLVMLHYIFHKVISQ